MINPLSSKYVTWQTIVPVVLLALVFISVELDLPAYYNRMNIVTYHMTILFWVSGMVMIRSFLYLTYKDFKEKGW